MKICSICNIEKSTDLFYKKPNSKFHTYCIACCTVKHKLHYTANREKYLHRARSVDKNKRRFSSLKCRLKADFNLSYEEFISLLEKQNNLCAVCKKPESTIEPRTQKTRHLSVDHCHKTGKIRGLLCNNCNRALGFLRDSTITIENLLIYLKTTPLGLQSN